MDESVVKHLEQPAELDDASKLLLKAADLIETRGHCKNALEKDGAFCAVGALCFAATGSPRDLPPSGHPYYSAFTRLYDALGCFPVDWNNAVERLKDEVVAKFRSVALGG